MVYMVYQLESPDITTIIDYCEDLLKDEKIEVYDFGKRRDLVLHIYVDEDFASKSIEYKIFTFRDGELVDKTMQHLKMEKMSWMSILKCWKPELI